jgi:VIT1/CCC1 family predicted Fe2+/Mn2+ transporter
MVDEEPDGLDPLLLDTVLRANAAGAALGFVTALALPVVAVLAATARWWSWVAVIMVTGASVAVATRSARRSARIERELAAMAGDP